MSARKRGPAKPRPTIAVTPLSVTTDNCFQVAGILPRKLREALALHPEVPRSAIGRTLILKADAFAELLELLQVEASPHGVEGDPDDLDVEDDDDIGEPADILKRAGLVRRSA